MVGARRVTVVMGRRIQQSLAHLHDDDWPQTRTSIRTTGSGSASPLHSAHRSRRKR